MLLLYNALLGLLAPFYFTAGLLLPAGRRFRTMRREGQIRLRAAIQRLSTEERVIWFHASSVGEMDQALGLIREIRNRGLGEKIFLSVFSASVQRTEHPEVDCLFHLPVDFPWSWGFLKEFRPALFATMTWDVFPNLLSTLKGRGIPSYLACAALAENSTRLKKPWVWFHRRVYSLLDGIGAVDQRNQEFFQQLHAKPDRVKITGDSRFDTIFYKLENTRLDAPVQHQLSRIEGPLFIFASTYAACDRAIFPALMTLAPNYPKWRFLFFPHHVGPDRIRETTLAAGSHGFHLKRFDQADPSDRFVLVDRLGVLALAYARADLVYVGGAFHHRVHNTAEPAALGCVVLTGPRIEASPVAFQLWKEGALIRCADSSDLEKQMVPLMTDTAGRSVRGLRAKALMEKQRGGSSAFYETFIAPALAVQK